MSITPYSQKNFIWNDAKLYTTFSLKGGKLQLYSPKHNHSHYEMFIYAQGHGTIKSNGKTIPFSKNSVIIIPPGVDHSIETAKGGTISLMTVCFTYKRVNEAKKQGGDRIYHFLDTLIPKDDVLVVKEIGFGTYARTFEKECEANHELASALIANLLENLFLRVLRILDKKNCIDDTVTINSYKSSAITNEVIISKTVENYLNEPGACLTGLAERLNMCPRNTQKIVKKIFGMTFSDKLRSVRMRSALMYLQDTDLSLADVAKLTNYNQYASFRKAFVATYGINPSDYRNNYKKEQ